MIFLYLITVTTKKGEVVYIIKKGNEV